MKEKKQEFVDWFYQQKPYWPTPPECFDWIIKNTMKNEPSYTNDDFESWVNKTWPQYDNSSAACRNAANKAMEWIRENITGK